MADLHLATALEKGADRKEAGRKWSRGLDFHLEGENIASPLVLGSPADVCNVDITGPLRFAMILLFNERTDPLRSPQSVC